MRCRGLAWPPVVQTADCSAAAGSGSRYRLSAFRGPVSVSAFPPRPWIAPGSESVVAVNEFLPPFALPAQEVSVNNFKILLQFPRSQSGLYSKVRNWRFDRSLWHRSDAPLQTAMRPLHV